MTLRKPIKPLRQPNWICNIKKGIVDLLTPPAPKETYAQGMMRARGVEATPGQAQAPAPVLPVKEVTYTVVSVSQLQYRWNAVLGYEGSLYSVHVGDILPADGSKVISISKSGVILEKEGKRKKVSMVPVI